MIREEYALAGRHSRDEGDREVERGAEIQVRAVPPALPAAAVHDYLPFDTPGDMERLMDLWRPRLLVFVKFDCWPNQVLAADRAGVPLVLLAVWGMIKDRGAWLWIIPFSDGRTSVGVVGDAVRIDSVGDSHRERLMALVRREPNALPFLPDRA